MAKFEWLWMNKAVEVVARRLAQAEPNRLSDPGVALAAAREEILEQAALGALAVEGMSSNLDAEISSEGNWKIIHASYWDECHRLNPTKDGLNNLADNALPEKLCTESSTAASSPRTVYDPVVYIDWEINAITFEIECMLAGGFHSLKVRSEDIDRIWPPPAVTGDDRGGQTSSISPNVATAPKNKGGRPPKYRILLLELIRIANTPDGLPLTPDKLLDRPRLKRQLQEFGVSYYGPDEC